MAWNFGDSFDLYATTADMLNSYWDSAVFNTVTFPAGRFAGSQALQWANSPNSLVKSSGVNDAVHHFVLAFKQTQAVSGTTLGANLQLSDGATAQCSIVFRSDGAIVLTSGGPAGTALATYTGAFTAANVWYAFEFEVKIDGAAGSFAVRKNGNSVNDFSATALNTRGGTSNNYANRLTLGMQVTVSAQMFDDLFWQSGAATGAWLGDIRCYTRMPASDAGVQFSKSPLALAQTPFSGGSTSAVSAGTARYTPFTAAYDGTIGSATVTFGTGYTGNLKCSIFAAPGGVPTTVLGSATVLVNPAAGSNTLTFGTPVAVVKGTQYCIGFDSDTSSGTWSINVSGTSGLQSTTAYASFPAASPATSTAAAIVCTLSITLAYNYPLVSEAQQDGATSYVFDSNVGDADFYGVGSIASTPATIIATTIRAYAQSNDAGSRRLAVQLKSGATTVPTPTMALSPSGFQWLWRTDLVDPNTGAAWLPANVSNALIGPAIVA